MANPGPASSQTTNTEAVLTPVNVTPVANSSAAAIPQGSNGLRLLAVARGVNLNAVGDTAMPLINTSSYFITAIYVTNASTSLTTAAAGIYQLAGGSGATGQVTVVTSHALSANTGPTVFGSQTVVPTTTLAYSTSPALYFNVATAQGAAATADVFVWGYDLS